MAKKINGWTISQRGEQWIAVNKWGQIGFSHTWETEVIRWARENEAKKIG